MSLAGVDIVRISSRKTVSYVPTSSSKKLKWENDTNCFQPLDRAYHKQACSPCLERTSRTLQRVGMQTLNMILALYAGLSDFLN